MKVKKLKIENFRGIRKMELELHPQMNVFIGVNGSGKSSVLDMIAMLFSRSPLFSDGDILPVFSKDIHRGIGNIFGGLHFDSLDSEYLLNMSFSEGHQSSDTISNNEESTNATGYPCRGLNTLRKEIADGELKQSYPLVVYYPINRAILDIPERIRGYRPVSSPLDALDGALLHSLDFRSFIARLRESENAITKWSPGQQSFSSFLDDFSDTEFFSKWYMSQVEAVQRAICGLNIDITSLHVHQRPFDIVVEKSGRELGLTLLSDGEKCLIALVGDLAQRLAIANPSLDNPLDGEGIVLIDEVDLHLHPQWQRMILPKMMKIFPKCQLIVSTHSPQILGEMRSEYVTILAEGEQGIEARKPAYEIYGQTSDVILADVMDTSKRQQEIETKLSNLFTAIDLGDLTEARKLKSDLECQAKDIPEYAKIELLMSRKEKLGK